MTATEPFQNQRVLPRLRIPGVFDFRPILLVLGSLLTTLGLAMVVPLLADVVAGNSEWQAFLLSSTLCLMIGGGLWLSNYGCAKSISLQQAFALTTCAWIVLPGFAAVPFALSGTVPLTYTDSFFEAMSGLTTTGSTVIPDLDAAGPGLLLWRGILQWLGGIGIIVMAIAVLPMLQVGGMQVFRLESSDTSEKILPRATSIVSSITLIYLSFTFVCALSYISAGMRPMDGAIHAMTTIATGGFSSHGSWKLYFDNPWIDWIAVGGMIAGSLPFVLYIQAFGGKPGKLFTNTQVHWFFGLLAALIVAMTLYQQAALIIDWDEALRNAAFNVTSIMTGTGYASADYARWGPFAVTFFFVIMFIGGCAGSTSCGIKIFRFQIVWAALKTQVRRLMHPHGVFSVRYEGKPIDAGVVSAVMSFLFLFFFVFAVSATLLSILGLDLVTSFSAAGTALANVGPGLGETIGPTGSFAPLPDAAKWILAVTMLMGRLELFTVLVMLTPRFWKA